MIPMHGLREAAPRAVTLIRRSAMLPNSWQRWKNARAGGWALRPWILRPDSISNIAVMNDTLRAVAALPEHRAQCLPGRFYTDLDYFRYEVETFLSKEWHCLGRADEIPGPGDYFTIRLFDEPLLVVRGVPALLYKRVMDTRHAVAAGLMQATTLTFVIVAAAIGRETGKLTSSAGAALVAAGLLSAALFPAGADRLLARGRKAASAQGREPVTALPGSHAARNDRNQPDSP